MGKASEQCVSCCVHFSAVLIIMIILVYGLNAGSVITQSESLLTGAATAQLSHAQLIVSNNAQWYTQVLEQFTVSVTKQQNDGQTTLWIAGEHKEVLRALLYSASQAEKRGDLVSYFIAVES